MKKTVTRYVNIIETTTDKRLYTFFYENKEKAIKDATIPELFFEIAKPITIEYEDKK